MLIDWKLDRLATILNQHAPVDSVIHKGGTVVEVIFQPQATQEQKDAAMNAVGIFDWSDAADDAYYAELKPNRKDLRDQAVAAIIRLDQIIDAPNPPMANLNQVVTALTNQILPAIRDIARYEKAVIKRLIEVD